MEQIIAESNTQREELLKKTDAERTDLHEKLAALQKDRDQSLLLSEQKKQQELSLLAVEKLSVEERFKRLQDDHHGATTDLERTRKDKEEEAEKLNQALNALRLELKRAKEQLDANKYLITFIFFVVFLKNSKLF